MVMQLQMLRLVSLLCSMPQYSMDTMNVGPRVLGSQHHVPADLCFAS